MYAICNPEHLETSLVQHLASIQHISFSHEQKCYNYRKGNQTFTAPGIHRTLKLKYYPHHKQKAFKRRKLTQSKGSSKKQGKEVDQQLFQVLASKTPPTHRMAIGLIRHFASLGQILHACQVPLWIPQLECITQADVITRDLFGRLHLWEVKTGFPIGGFREQGKLRGLDVPNTKISHWLLQVRYTELGFAHTGVKFASASVIQIYDYWDKEKHEKMLKIKVHKMPKWAKELK